MENNKKVVLSFNKRISLVKKVVFESLKETKELDNIKGTNTTGFYSLATIEKYLFPALDMYDLDLDLEIFPDKIVGHWYDCIGDGQRDIEIDFHRIENVEKLQLMANMVQSEGAVKSYTRRYALTAILRLPSTDLIDGNQPKKPNNNNNSNNNNNNYNNNNSNNKNNNNNNSKITHNQIKRYYKIAETKGIDKDYLDILIKTAYNIKSKNDWLRKDYDMFTKYMEQHDSKDTLNILISKIKKEGKQIPEKSEK
jgi:hypothetical protein